MIPERTQRFAMPRTVDQAAELLISDMLIEHLDALSHLDRRQFDALCQAVAPYMVEEFRLFSGNEALLDDCLRQASSTTSSSDPVIIILDCVRRKLADLYDIFIVE